MVSLSDVVEFCSTRAGIRDVADFDGSWNGLQVENNGQVTHIGAAVDASLQSFQLAAARGVDFLICHHGLFWTPPIPITGPNRAKILAALESNLAVFGAHLPLDCHPEIGNNAILGKRLGLRFEGTFLPYQGVDIAWIGSFPDGDRTTLHHRLKSMFPETFTALEFGSAKPEKIAVLTGSGQSAVACLRDAGVDTLITGELRQKHFVFAQEHHLNLYPCGHYATETFGVDALAREAAASFKLPYTFLETGCPL